MHMKHFLLSTIILTTTSFAGTQEGNFLEDIGSDSSSFEFNDTESDEKSSFKISPTFSIDVDLLVSEDINVQRYSTDLQLEHRDTTVGIAYSRIQYDLDITGESVSPVNETTSTDRVTLTLGQEWTDKASSSFSLSGYQGFTNFRSIWINQIFEQDLGGAPGFRDANPFGFSANLSNTFILPNDFDSITWGIGYSRDRIAAGQQIETFPGPPFIAVTQGNDTLDTISTSLTGNFFITNKFTTQWFFRAAFVSAREVRTQYRIKTAWNIIDKLTLRGEIGATIERPNFESYYGGATLSYQITAPLSLTVGYRIYTDTGEVTTSNFNSSAPELDSTEISASMRWSNGTHSLSTSVAFLQTDFGTVNSASAPFEDLFSDREFFAIRAAYTYQF